MKRKDLLEGVADVGAGREGGAGPCAQAIALEFETKLEVEELFKDEAAMRGGGGGLELSQRGAGLGKVQGAQASMRPGMLSRSRKARGMVSSGSALASTSSSNTDHMTRRVHLDVSFAPQGVVPPSDS